MTDPSSERFGGPRGARASVSADEFIAHPAFHFRGRSGLEALSVTCVFEAPRPDDFQAELRSVVLGSIRIDDLRSTAHSCERTLGKIDSDVSDAVTIGVVVSGAAHSGHADERSALGEGDLIVHLNARRFRYETETSTRLVSAEIPVQVLGVTASRLSLVVGRPMAPSPLSTAFAALLRGLCDTPPQAGPGVEFAERGVVELARTLVAERLTIDVEHPRADAMARTQRYLARLYSNPSVDAARAAADLGMSLRQLHRLFEDEPTTFGRYLRQLRLRHLADDLLSSDRPFKELARLAGFGSVDAAERAFRQEFGRSPAEHRRLLSDAGGDDASESPRLASGPPPTR